MFQVISHLNAIWICQHIQSFSFFFLQFPSAKRELECRALQAVDENVKSLEKTLTFFRGQKIMLFIGSDFYAVHKENGFPSLLVPCSANPSV